MLTVLYIYILFVCLNILTLLFSCLFCWLELSLQPRMLFFYDQPVRGTYIPKKQRPTGKFSFGWDVSSVCILVWLHPRPSTDSLQTVTRASEPFEVVLFLPLPLFSFSKYPTPLLVPFFQFIRILCHWIIWGRNFPLGSFLRFVLPCAMLDYNYLLHIGGVI